MGLSPIKLLFTGDYDPEYNRNRIILSGLKKLNAEVIGFPFKKKSRRNKKKLAELSSTADIVYLPSFTHRYVRFVKNAVSKPVIFDPLISRYLTKVHDYRQVSPYSLRAWKNLAKDMRSMKAADLVLADTEAHKRYFQNKTGISAEKIKVLPVGTETSFFFPETTEEKEVFTVGFYGGFIPLQGVSKMIESAYLLRNRPVRFIFAGTGFEFEKAKRLAREKKLENISFPGWVSFENLNDCINSFDICLGIFGDTPKADIVVPNKVYHYASAGKAIITRDSEAIKEVFSNKENIFLVRPRPEEIADAILYLMDHPNERKKIGNNSRKLMEEKYSEIKIASLLLEYCRELKG